MARFNFADVPEQKEFNVLPAGKYDVQISNLTTRHASQNSQNPGALVLRWEFEVINGDYENRKVWDNQICIENTLWKIRALLDSLQLDTSSLSYDDETEEFTYRDAEGDEQQLDMDDYVGENLTIKVGVRPARKEGDREYPAQNRVNNFYVYTASDADLLKG